MAVLIPQAAMAQVFDVSITKSGEQTAVVSVQSVKSITIASSERNVVRVSVTNVHNTASQPVVFDLNVRYDFSLTAVASINPGEGGLPDGDFPAQAPMRNSEEGEVPTLTSPALVIVKGSVYTPYYLSDYSSSLSISMHSDGSYKVGTNDNISGVTGIYFYAPELIDVAGGITWNDNDNHDGKRPTSVTVKLLANSTEKESKTVTASDNWAFTFTDLLKYDNGLSAIAYSLTMPEVTGYDSIMSGNNVTYTKHALTETTAKAATCTETGNTLYYQCGNCQRYFSDAVGMTEIAEGSWVINARGHDFTGKILSSEADANGLYSYVCGHECGTEDADHKVIKEFTSSSNLELDVDSEGLLSSSQVIELVDNNQFKGVNVTFDAPSAPTYSRTMRNQWGTIVVPFDVAYDDSKPFDLFKLADVSSDGLSLTKVTSTLNAGTPVLIRMSEAAYNETAYELSLTAANTTVNTSVNNPDAVGGLTFTGELSIVDITDKNGYIISNNKFWNIQIVKGENKVYCAPFRAYLAGTVTSADSAPASLNIVSSDEEVSAIDVVEALTVGNAEYYDIDGRRMTDLQKGVNIVNVGNKNYKVIIK